MCNMPATLPEPLPDDITRECTSLVKIGNALYIRSVSRHYSEPIASVLYWPITLQLEVLEYWPDHRYGKLGQLVRFNNSSSVYPHWRTLEPPYNEFKPVDANSNAEYYETIPVPEPKQRGKKCPTRYYAGHWQKETARGWISAE